MRMSFSNDWLGLREPADHRARAAFAAVELRQYDRVVDLGCGTGSNFRYLAPRLAAEQRWLCVDNDRSLLDRLGERTGQSEDWTVDTHIVGDTITAEGPCRASIELLEHDLSRALPEITATPGTIVAASALLDLVSCTWLQAAAQWCASHRIPALFALTFDGRMRCVPEHPFDAEVFALVNRHQLGDKGFGPALGPGAVQAAIDAFTANGYASLRVRSDWQIDAEPALQLALATGWCEAACELAPQRRDRIAVWLEQRAAEIEAGKLAITVGHEDLLFLPAQPQ
jgi:SAM-dependent methyltransferase